MFRDTIIPGAYGIFSENEKYERISACKYLNESLIYMVDLFH